MARVIGTVVFGGHAPDKYVIHCTTTGITLRPLFTDVYAAEIARTRYNEGDHDAPYRAVPAIDRTLRVVRIEIPHIKPEFALATADRVFARTDDYDRGWVVVEVDGVAHIGEHQNAGWFGDFWAPICNLDLVLGPHGEFKAGKVDTLDSYFGQELTLCAACLSHVVPHADSQLT